jgi:stearoyl-CoA desaturase (delta-9 desaturase)
MALSGKSLSDAAQFGASLLVWGGALRTVACWHITWSVNSVTHVWGYRNYATPDGSRNNAWIALIATGEGWHNNHHADSRSARHGHEWWEFDVTWMVIRLLMLLGLAWNVATPSPALKEKFNSRGRWLVPAGAEAFDQEIGITLASQSDTTRLTATATASNGFIA